MSAGASLAYIVTMRRFSLVFALSAFALTPTAALATPSVPAPPARPTAAPKAPPVAPPKVRPAPIPKIAPKAVATPAPEVPEVAAIDQATAFVKRLAPKPGFAYDVADYHKLDAPTQAVLDTFAKVRNHVLRVAGENGVGEAPGRFDNPETDPRHVTAELNAALKEHGYSASDAATLLRAAARKRSIGKLMKEVLVESADVWETKSRDDGWKTAVKLKSPPPVLHEPGTQPQGPSYYELQLLDRAEAEWARAPRARGWGPDRKELVKHYPDNHYTPADVRAFTHESWIAWRTAQLRAEDEHRAYIDLTFGVARHR